MSTFETSLRIEAPIARVWEVLADIGNIDEWNPGVANSHVSTDRTSGSGAGRHCDLGGGNYLEEEVVEWDPESRLTLRIVETNLPFETADIRFSLRSDGPATVVSVSPVYSLRFGLLGRMLDFLWVRRTYEKGMRALLRGLKTYVETGESPGG